ncbi:hypothetical protein SOPP22_11200 [Shewanella sp. OPT22]|nr:hypothetical protein SOPP22_11200 [Shewanella sp. OPT22]
MKTILGVLFITQFFILDVSYAQSLDTHHKVIGVDQLSNYSLHTDGIGAGTHDYVTIKNDTLHDGSYRDEEPYFGKTNIAVLFTAKGCTEYANNQLSVCKAEYDITLGELATYHFESGTSSRHVLIGVPKGHWAEHEWNFGAPLFHFSFSVNNKENYNVCNIVYGIDDWTQDQSEYGSYCKLMGGGNLQCQNSNKGVVVTLCK